MILNLVNNTPSPQSLSLFNPQQPNITADNTTNNTYTWDMTSELANAALYSSNVIALSVNVNSGPYVTLFYTNPSGTFTNVAQIVTGLNTLGLGTFSNPSGNLVQLVTNQVLSSISITNLYTAVAMGNGSYSRYGTMVHAPGFNLNGTGTLTRIPPANTWWINTFTNTTDGPMNRNAIWNVAIPMNQEIGCTFSYNNTGAARQVYIGLGGDDDFEFYLNGVLTVNYDITANIADILAQTGVTTVEPSYECFNVYPITLQPGNNLIQMYNKNFLGAPSALAVEIYDNTAAQIIAATSYATLNVLFRTASLVGQNLF